MDAEFFENTFREYAKGDGIELPEDFDKDAPLTDFGFDSLDLLEIVLKFETLLGVKVPDEHFNLYKISFNEIFEYFK